ncbi:MAG TPA: SAM-dependent methyltransferase, partial [Cyanobacteria bacterium UBA11149]|nr:SAM-dependent methyltransferase [Cyanobacteria bacterium UBA11149]
MTNQDKIAAVQRLYDTYPFPPEPLLDEPPPGYNWRWNWITAYSFCTGQKPQRQDIRILDAGCGTGVGTEYLVHLNPQASVVGIDLSGGALEVAKERCRRSGANRVEFHHLSLYDVAQLEGEFDLINSVGVLHHLPDPIRGIQALAGKLAPGGLLHIFVYAELGRWEIQLMQEAIAILQGNQRGDYRDGVKVGRDLFASLPENNRLVKREKERWSWENQRDECFADMYVHPQEIDYNTKTLFELIDASGLEFVGFSNSRYWDIERLVGKNSELMERAKGLSQRQLYRLIEVLDPEITHYEFFLTRPPLAKVDWSDDNTLLAAIPELSPCMNGWPSKSIFDYDYQVVQLSEIEFAFLQAC